MPATSRSAITRGTGARRRARCRDQGGAQLDQGSKGASASCHSPLGGARNGGCRLLSDPGRRTNTLAPSRPRTRANERTHISIGRLEADHRSQSAANARSQFRSGVAGQGFAQVRRRVRVTVNETTASTVAAGPDSIAQSDQRNERGRVLIYVPRSFYYNADIRNPDREPTRDELLAMRDRTERQIHKAVGLVIPETDSWKVDIDIIPDDVSRSPLTVLPSADDPRRQVVEWGIVSAVGAAVSILAAVGSWIHVVRRPTGTPEQTAQISPLPCRLRVGPGPVRAGEGADPAQSQGCCERTSALDGGGRTGLMTKTRREQNNSAAARIIDQTSQRAGTSRRRRDQSVHGR